MNSKHDQITPNDATGCGSLSRRGSHRNVHRGVFAIYFGIVFAFILFVIKTHYT